MTTYPRPNACGLWECETPIDGQTIWIYYVSGGDPCICSSVGSTWQRYLVSSLAHNRWRPVVIEKRDWPEREKVKEMNEAPYREPTAEDVGREIEVRDDKKLSWNQRIFGGKVSGWFVCESRGGGMPIPWRYARVPVEDEHV